MNGKWHEAECVSVTQPPEREYDSSNEVIYLRKDFIFHQAYEEDNEMIPAKWTYKETTVPKDVAELLSMTDENTVGIAGLEDALCEISMEM